MGDDIRDRFRGARSRYQGDIRPSMAPPRQQPAQQPAPAPRPSQRPAQPQMFGQPSAAPRYPAPAATPQPMQQPPIPPQAATKRGRKAARAGKKKGGKKLLFASLALVVLLGGAGSAAYFMKNKQAKTASVPSGVEPQALGVQDTAPRPTGTIDLLVTGDFSAYDSVNTAAKTAAGYDYAPIMAPMKPVFDKFDIRFCNQATLGGGIKYGVSGFPAFNAPTEWSKGLEDLGCNLINMGSNHTNDKGQEALDAAVTHYDKRTNILAVAGANRNAEEQAKIRYFTVKQLKFSFLSFTTSTLKPGQAFSINIYNADTAKKQIEEARKNSQFIIVSMNWGKEDSGDVQPEQEAIAQELVTNGADLIIGNGPHVVQPAKVLNGTGGRQGLVWFSLGNAVNSQLPTDNLFGGVGIVTIDISTQFMTNPRFLPTYMHYEWTAAEKASGRLDARKNLAWYPLDAAAAQLAKSQNGTTVEAQTERLKGIITKFVPVTMVKSTELD